jgi:hypothetical protein
MAEATVRVAAPSLEDVFRFLLQRGGRGALP